MNREQEHWSCFLLALLAAIALTLAAGVLIWRI
jgi:hypothetical protein